MKYIFLTLLTFSVYLTTSAQTQSGMNQNENQKFLQADKTLNKTYQSVLKEYKTDVAFIKNLRISQKLWIKFRDAEISMMYPAREAGYYGSMNPACIAMYKTELTQQRTEKLKLWLNGEQEGESCTSSIKMKP